jgi:hypothetical protein
MTTLIDLLIATFSTSYFIGAIDAFYDLKKLKGFVALGFSVLALYFIGYSEYDLALMSTAAAFASLAIMAMLDRPVTIQPPRRY